MQNNCIWSYHDTETCGTSEEDLNTKTNQHEFGDTTKLIIEKSEKKIEKTKNQKIKKSKNQKIKKSKNRKIGKSENRESTD
jgi:hypothetical protein